MTVNTASNKITYTANGSTTQWTFPFPGIDAQFIEVTIVDTFGTVINIDPDFYSVFLNAPIDPNPTGQGGYVTYPLTGPPLAAGSLLSIIRNLPAVQSTSIANQSIVYPPVIEQEFDYLTLLMQGGVEEFTRAFRVGPADPPPAIVPPVAQRAGHSAFFDSLGNLTPGDIPGPGVFISAVMTPVVEAATLPLARQLMGITQAIADGLLTICSTGDLKPTHKTVADPGWILWSDGTIGDAGSGSTIRSNADTLALFSLYYDGYNDTICPLKTSAGAATTRAAQGVASAAFSSKCRMSLPLGAGRALSVAGSGIGLTNRPIGSTDGAELDSPTIAKMAIHRHTGNSGGEFVCLPEGPAPTLFIQVDAGTETNIYLDAVGYTGAGQPTNILSPSAYANVMVKL